MFTCFCCLSSRLTFVCRIAAFRDNPFAAVLPFEALRVLSASAKARFFMKTRDFGGLR